MKNKLISLFGLVSKKELLKAKKTIKIYGDSHMSVSQEMYRLKEELSKASKSLEWHVDASKSLVNSLNQTKVELSKVNAELGKKTIYAKYVQEKNAEMSSELIVLTTKIEDLKRENESLGHSLFKTQEFSKYLRQKNTRLKSEAEGLEEEINALNNLRASDQQAIKELSNERK